MQTFFFSFQWELADAGHNTVITYFRNCEKTDKINCDDYTLHIVITHYISNLVNIIKN